MERDRYIVAYVVGVVGISADDSSPDAVVLVMSDPIYANSKEAAIGKFLPQTMKDFSAANIYYSTCQVSNILLDEIEETKQD